MSTHSALAASVPQVLAFVVLLFPCVSTSEPKTPEKPMNESSPLSSRLEPWGGPLQATVVFEISKTTDPLEFRFTVTNENPGPIRFRCGPGNISVGFRDSGNLPIQTPSIQSPMDPGKGAKDPNDELVEFYEIKKDGKPGERFRETIFSLDPKSSKRILVKMGPEMMRQVNGFLRMQNPDTSEVKLGVRTLFSIRSPEDREFFARFRTEQTMFFSYKVPKK